MPKRAVGRGKKLVEDLTKGSMEYTLSQIRKAFYTQFRERMYEDECCYFYIEEIFEDHVIVQSEELQRDEFYYVPYTTASVGGRTTYTFADKDAWEIVELTYQPQTITEGKRHQMIDVSPTVRLNERVADTKTRTITAEAATADEVNGNGRRYSLAVLTEAVAEARQRIQTSLKQGVAAILGEEEHPSDKGQSARLTETIVVWTDITMDPKSKKVLITGNMVDNSNGRDATATMEAGVFPGVSLRGYGDSRFIKEKGQSIEEVDWVRFTGFDLVMNPSFSSAAVTTLEAKGGRNKKMAGKTGTEEELEETKATPPAVTAELIIQDHPDIVSKVVAHEQLKQKLEADEKRKRDDERMAEVRKYAAAEEKQLREMFGLDDTADLKAALAEHKAKTEQLAAKENERQVVEYIDKQIKGLTAYPDGFRESFAEAIKAAAPKTVEEAKQEIVKQRAVFDGLLSKMRLASKGMGVLQVLGPTLESETGVPEYAGASFAIAESLRAHGLAKSRKLFKKEALTPAEIFAVRALERFDENYRQQLKEEARLYKEAETTSDLSLPYSTIRAIIEEAYPELIAANIFDFGTMDTADARIYYESQYAGESGSLPTVTGSNNVNAAALDTWYTLSAGHKRLNFSSLSMQPSGGGTPYTYGIDYVIDIENGRYMLLTGGAMAISTNYDLDYTYNAVRKGENTTIERGKAQLAYVVASAAADRLALQITTEAILFSRSQLGWDAAMQSINLLVKELRRIIDGTLLNLSLTMALTVSGNIGGTWNSATDTLQTLVEYILAAKTKVENRYYTPTYILMSKTRGNKLLLWDGFTAAGTRPGFMLNDAPGFLGEIAGLPVFCSTEFPDGWVGVGNREIIQHRLYRAMQMKGPLPAYSSGQLVGAEEYYVEEFNATIYPLPGKASAVRII